MSLTMLAPHPPRYGISTPRRGGILLNNNRQPSSPARPSLPPPSASSASSASQSASEDSSKGKSPSRRITFAPLPRPRAHSNQDRDDDGLPVIVIEQNGVSYDAPDHSGDDNALEPVTYPPSLDTKKPSSWGHSTKKLLRPFYKPKSPMLDVDAGALGLFRSSSRESTASSAGTLTDSAKPVKRRMSTGSSPFSLGSGNHVYSDVAHLALTPVASENGGSAAGKRMLNGRVYGGSRVHQVKRGEHTEPEFVEWGYGGMGSNSGSHASSAYAKVQSSHKNVVAADNDEDGSGMGWVRKRREAREREKKEREAREAEQLAEFLPETSADAPEHITHAVTFPSRSTHSGTASGPLSGRTSPSKEDVESESPSEEDSNEGSAEKDEDESEPVLGDEAGDRQTSKCAGVEKLSRHKE